MTGNLLKDTMIQTMHCKILQAFFFPLLLSFGTVLATKYPAVFNFGDSNSDTGGLCAGLGFTLSSPYGQNFKNNNKAALRFSDGLLIIDFLMEAMGLPYLNPYLDALGTPNFAKGCNFATGGSTIINATAYSLQLLHSDKKYESYVPNEDAFKEGLYIFDIGQNDIVGGFYSKTLVQILALIPSLISDLQKQIQRMYYDGGARKFRVHNTGPAGCLPAPIAYFGKSAALDSTGCLKSHETAVEAFNKKLLDLCVRLKAELHGAELTYVDIFSIKLGLIKNHALLGFKESIEACCGHGGAPLNYDNNVPCGNKAATVCVNSSEFVNWDGIHYTQAANKYVASQIVSEKYTRTI